MPFEKYVLKRLFFARLLGALFVLLVFSWLGHGESNFLRQVFVLWLVLLVIQVMLFRFPDMNTSNLLIQLLSDLLLIGILIYGRGGVSSPFIFLLGIPIIVAGSQARVWLALLMAVLAALVYLSSIYSYAVLLQSPMLAQQTLHVLLQTSVLLLVGGIMAMIARRHVDLQREQRQTKTKHRRLQELHSQVLASMQEGVVILDESFCIQDFNQATIHVLQVGSQHIGQDLSRVLHIPQVMRDYLQQPHQPVFRCECQHQGQPLLLTLTRLLEEHAAWLLTIVNVSEVRQLERQLAEQDKLASIGQMAAMLAHEIRNPMQTIAQAVELMSIGQSKLNLERIVADEISRLNRLVSDMLDYAHPLHPHAQSLNIQTLIQASITQVDLQDTLKIQMDVEPLQLHIDPDHFRLLLDNLLRNAVVSSPEVASIVVRCVLKNETWQLSVRDHGSGIAAEIRGTIFEPFKTGRKQGTGLGLATVWQVCQVNGWTIRVDDAVEDGACFLIQGEHKKDQVGQAGQVGQVGQVGQSGQTEGGVSNG
ncbi:MAG: ATP-binding protein [Mariprofundaceae bacterium]|nr:ATP-binding protein [Mariprofundaceae bacterium]